MSVRAPAPLALLFPVMAGLWLLGCSRHPAVQLPTRSVDDPVTLPAAMVAVSAGVSIDRAVEFQRGMGMDDLLLRNLRWGINHRLELRAPLQLTYAVLDERPADGRTPAPFSLALRGGLGFQVYQRESTVQPLAGLQLGKRIHPAVALWVEGDVAVTTAVAPEWSVVGRRWSGFVGATVQIISRLALTLGTTGLVFSGRQPRRPGTVLPPRGRRMEVAPTAALHLRLAWWADVAVTGDMRRARFQPDGPPDLSSPDDRVPQRPDTSWTPQASLLATLRW